MIQTAAAKLKALRNVLKAEKLNGFIVPRQDEFQGEYVAPYAERLRWLTGFAGSWGTAIVTDKKAAIFVDGRYTTQVRVQTDGKLYTPQHLVDAPPTAWVSANLKKGETLGFDPMLLTVSEARRFQKACAEVGAKLAPVKKNLIDQIWEDQPARSQKPLFVQPDKFAGKSAAQKLKDLAAGLKKAGHVAAFLAEPSSVAWLLNLRGLDVAYTPVVLAYAILHANAKAELFIESSRVPDEVKKALKGIATVYDPKELAARLKKLAKGQVLLDENSAPDHVRAVLEAAKAKVVYGTDPCTMPKAQKNAVEQQGARDAQVRDGAALSNFLHWMSVEGPKGQLDEKAAAASLQKFRQATNMLEDLSFPSISAAGEHAAIPHYFVTDESSAPIKNNEIFLMDSGGQYRDGTTDVTRTMIVGTPTAEMKDRFTRVLKGVIGISVARFPEGTTGAHIDALARNALWQAGLDFDHGTGHGVGSFLSVHEGPARISKASHVPLRPGMILSNEPGYYKPGHFGIRIENLLIVTEPSEIEGGERKMMGFETLTWAPIDRHLIEVKLLTPDELTWLNAYHERVEKELSPRMSGEALVWLKESCAAL
ncbi:aminopeptidase P family protein [Aestuariivirga litoralis]|uniref:aminopeptidase P family protein n=1 Tax=Aestuariivirga litoralis TaxID=2650924 RepID=UPI0018C65281|nr:aminopeptidase P family protein [Aestuariivirga litoralis]MBG1231985.1 aminopeptidase P family protein [Aestuariivirga litoralis]